MKRLIQNKKLGTHNKLTTIPIIALLMICQALDIRAQVLKTTGPTIPGGEGMTSPGGGFSTVTTPTNPGPIVPGTPTPPPTSKILEPFEIGTQNFCTTNTKYVLITFWLNKDRDYTQFVTKTGSSVITLEELYAGITHKLYPTGNDCVTIKRGQYNFIGLVFYSSKTDECALDRIIFEAEAEGSTLCGPSTLESNGLTFQFINQKGEPLKFGQSYLTEEATKFSASDLIFVRNTKINKFEVKSYDDINTHFEGFVKGVPIPMLTTNDLLFSYDSFKRLYNAHKSAHAQTKIKPLDFFKAITHKGLPGFFFRPSRISYGEKYNAEHLHVLIPGLKTTGLCRLYIFHFYITNLSEISSSAGSFFEINESYLAESKKYTHTHFKMKVGREATQYPGRPLLVFYTWTDESNINGQAFKTSISEDDCPKNAWMHIALAASYTYISMNGATSKARIRATKIIILSCLGRRETTKETFQIEMAPFFLMSESEEISNNHSQLGMAWIQPKEMPENLLGLRLFDYKVFHNSAWMDDLPRETFNPHPKQGSISRCLVKGVLEAQCYLYAFRGEDFESMAPYYLLENLLKEKSDVPEQCKDDKCRVCFENKCMLTKAGYNRELTQNPRNRLDQKDRKLLKEESLKDPELAKLVVGGRAKFTGDDGVDYWFKCPLNCLECDENTDCLSCPDGSAPIQDLFSKICPKKDNCERRTKDGSCSICEQAYYLVKDSETGQSRCQTQCDKKLRFETIQNLVCTDKCPVSASKCQDCIRKGSEEHHCPSCRFTDDRLIDPSTSTTPLEKLGSLFSEEKDRDVYCRSSKNKIRGFYPEIDGPWFKPCPENCLYCSGAESCLECIENYSLNSQNKCQACSSGCLKCKDGSRECLECRKGFDFIEGRNYCKVDWSQKKSPFWQEVDNTCQPCSENCKKCKDSSGECLECSSQEFLLDPLNLKNCLKIELPVSVIGVEYIEAKTRLIIGFNQQVKVSDFGKFKFKMVTPAEQKTILEEIPVVAIGLDEAGKALEVDFNLEKLKKTILDFTIEMTDSGIPTADSGSGETEESNFASLASIISTSNPKIVFFDYPITKANLNHFYSETAKRAVVIAKSTTYILNTVVFFMLIVSVGMASSMIKMVQMVYFIIFLNIKIPSNASKFIESFKKSIFDYFPNLPKKHISVDTTDCTIHPVFRENGLECLGILNIGGYFMQFVGFIILKLALVLLLKAVERWWRGARKVEKDIKKAKNEDNNTSEVDNHAKPDKLEKGKDEHSEDSKDKLGHKTEHKGNWLMKNLLKFEKLLNFGYFFNLVIALELKVLLGAILGIKHSKTGSAMEKLDLAFSTSVTAFYVILIVFTGFLVIQQAVASEKSGARWDYFKISKMLEIYKETKKGLRLGNLVILLKMLNDLLIPVFVIFLVTNPKTKILIILVLQAVYIIQVGWFAPYNDIVLNLVEFVNSGFYLILMLIFLVSKLKGDGMDAISRYLYIGFSSIVVIFLMLFFNFFMNIVMMVRNCRNKKRKVNKIGNKDKDRAKEVENGADDDKNGSGGGEQADEDQSGLQNGLDSFVQFLNKEEPSFYNKDYFKKQSGKLTGDILFKRPPNRSDSLEIMLKQNEENEGEESKQVEIKPKRRARIVKTGLSKNKEGIELKNSNKKNFSRNGLNRRGRGKAVRRRTGAFNGNLQQPKIIPFKQKSRVIGLKSKRAKKELQSKKVSKMKKRLKIKKKIGKDEKKNKKLNPELERESGLQNDSSGYISDGSISSLDVENDLYLI